MENAPYCMVACFIKSSYVVMHSQVRSNPLEHANANGQGLCDQLILNASPIVRSPRRPICRRYLQVTVARTLKIAFNATNNSSNLKSNSIASPYLLSFSWFELYKRL